MIPNKRKSGDIWERESVCVCERNPVWLLPTYLRTMINSNNKRQYSYTTYTCAFLDWGLQALFFLYNLAYPAYLAPLLTPQRCGPPSLTLPWVHDQFDSFNRILNGEREVNWLLLLCMYKSDWKYCDRGMTRVEWRAMLINISTVLVIDPVSSAG
jgi:hypothetical protein